MTEVAKTDKHVAKMDGLKIKNVEQKNPLVDNSN